MGCGLKINCKNVEVRYLKERPIKKRCLFNHKFTPIGHVYKNHIPMGVCIYLVCEKCGFEKNHPTYYATIERISENVV